MSVNPFLTEEQKRKVESVRVGVAGAGGLGSNCAAHLVRSGVRHLVLADGDVVSESNLNRQFFFADQVGRRKVDALAENLRRITPGLVLETFAGKIVPENAGEVFGGCEIVVEAFDAVSEKGFFVSRMLEMGKTVVAASGVAGWGETNRMGVRNLGQKLYLCGDFVTEVSDKNPPVSPRVGMVAAMQANVVMAVILGVEF